MCRTFISSSPSAGVLAPKLVSRGRSSGGRYDVNLSADQTTPERRDLEQTINRPLLSRQRPLHLLLITRTLQNCRRSCKTHAAVSTLYPRLIQKLKVFTLIHQMQLAKAHTIELQWVFFLVDQTKDQSCY